MGKNVIPVAISGSTLNDTSPAPSTYTSSNTWRTPLAKDLKLSNHLNEQIFKTRYIFNRLRSPLLSSNVQIWGMILKNTFRQFSSKSSPELDLFLFFHDDCLKCSPLWNLDLILLFTASSWPFSFCTLFYASTTLRAIVSPWKQEWCHSVWFFNKLRTWTRLKLKKSEATLVARSMINKRAKLHG